MDEYTVEFRIYGKDLNPSTISNSLELEPTLITEGSDRRGENRRWTERMWAYNGFPESYGIKIWGSLEEGLGFMLEKLLPLKSKLEIYKKDFTLILWCGTSNLNRIVALLCRRRHCKCWVCLVLNYS